ncbi:MAG: S-layer homology domain-containing protein [Clostridia bacterium]|nr:S-layer homology domain-containing protein [Clostridia bacterium]
MTGFLESKSRFISFIMIFAVLFAYMPGLADAAYAQEDVNEIVLSDDVTASNGNITGAGLTTDQASFEHHDNGNYVLNLKNIDDSNLVFKVAVPSAEKKHITIWLGSSCTIGAIEIDEGCIGNIYLTKTDNDDCVLNVKKVNNAVRLCFTNNNITVNADSISATGNITLSSDYNVKSTLNCKEVSAGGKVEFDMNSGDMGHMSFNIEKIKSDSQDIGLKLSAGTVNLGQVSVPDGTVQLFGGKAVISGSLEAKKVELKGGELKIAAGTDVSKVKDLYYSTRDIVHVNATTSSGVVSNFAADDEGHDGGFYGVTAFIMSLDGEGYDYQKLPNDKDYIFKSGVTLKLNHFNEDDIKDIKFISAHSYNHSAGSTDVAINTGFPAGDFNLVKINAVVKPGKQIKSVKIGDRELSNFGKQYFFDVEDSEGSGVSQEFIVCVGDLPDGATSAAIDIETEAATYKTITLNCNVGFHQGPLRTYCPLGEKIDAEYLQAVFPGVIWYEDEAHKKAFNMDTEITEDITLYGYLPMKKVTGSMEVKPVVACEGENYKELCTRYSGSCRINDEGSLVLLSNGVEDGIYTYYTAQKNGNAIAWSTLTSTAIDGEGDYSLSDSGKVYFMPAVSAARFGYELDGNFKFKWNNEDLPICDDCAFIPIVKEEHDAKKLATNDGTYRICTKCGKFFEGETGSTPASLEEIQLKSINDDITSDTEGNKVLSLSEDIYYGKNTKIESPQSGQVILDLNGHRLGSTKDIWVNGEATLVIKNGTIDLKSIIADNVVFENVSGAIDCVTGDQGHLKSLTLATGSSVHFNGPMNLGSDSSDLKLEIKDSSKLYADLKTLPQVATLAVMSPDMNFRVFGEPFSAGLYKQLSSYAGKNISFLDYYDASGEAGGKKGQKYIGLCNSGTAVFQVQSSSGGGSGHSGGGHSGGGGGGAVSDIPANAVPTDKSAEIVKTEEKKDAAGNTAVITTDSNGKQAADVKISEDAAKQAAAENKPIALPVPEVKPEKDATKATAIKVSFPEGTKKAEVSVPVTAATDTTVLMKVNEDGTMTPVPTSVVSEDGKGLVANLEAGNYVAVDNKVTFNDVKDGAWYKEGADFAGSRGLMEGVGNGNFGQNMTLGKAQVQAVIDRLGGADKAESWNNAVAKFGTKEKCDRMTTLSMLHDAYKANKGEAAVKPNREVLAKFKDAASIPEEYVDTFCWAIEKGIIQGMDDGTLNPTGELTRGQFGLLLERTVKALSL